MLRCPSCGSDLPYNHVHIAKPFKCSVCGERLCVGSLYLRLNYWGSVLFSVLVPLAFGLRGFSLVLAIVPLWVVISVLALILIKRIIPPKIERCHRELTLDGREKPLL